MKLERDWGYGRRRIRLRAAPWVVAMLAACAALPAQAQVQRSFINLGFEQPALTGNDCFLIFSADLVPGWDTNHPNNLVAGTCTLAGSPAGAPITRPIEIWRRALNGVAPRAGNQHAELNAYVPSRMSQTVCLVHGERVSWRLSHRGRSGVDVMSFNIDTTANEIVRASTSEAGAGSVGAGSCGTGLVTGAVCNAPVTVTTPAPVPTQWADYTGSFIWNGASGSHNLGFEAITGAGGLSFGNFLDEIQITLRPFVEFTTARSVTREGQTAVVPQIHVFGTVPAGGITVGATITAGTATLGSDYTTAGGGATINISVPAGTYDNAVFSAPISSVIDDSLIEDNETVTLRLQTSPGDYTLTSTTGCNQIGILETTWVLLDNDVDVRTTKTVANANPPAGGNAVFTVTYQNNTARPTVGSGTELQVHDAGASLADALPAGFSAFAWTCAASGSPAPVCPAASGSGAINASATLPAGNAGAAGGSLTYTVTGTLDPAGCAAIPNTASATAVAPTAEATAAQAGFVTPVPGGTANNNATVAVDPACLTLNKITPTAPGGPFGFALSNTVQVSGTVTTVAAGTAVQVDGQATPAGVQPFGILAPGVAVSIDETALPAGYLLTAATCSNGSATVGSRSGSVYTIAAAEVVAGADFTCTFTNARQPILRWQKTFAATGRFGVNDQVQLSIAPASGPALTATTTGNNAAVTSPPLALDPATAATSYTLSESAATTVPATSLSHYTATVTCANATSTSTTPLPVAGSAYPAAGVVLTPAFGDDIACTVTNTRGAISDLSISKTNTPASGASDQAGDSVIRGALSQYRIVVSNNGPDAVTGAVVRDPADPSLVCATPVSCGGAACPSANVALATLQSAGGLALGALANGDSVTLTLNCTVQ